MGISKEHAEALRKFESRHYRWYYVEREMFRQLDQPNSPLAKEFQIKTVEPWKRRSCFSRSTEYEIRADGDAVTVSCTRQDDGTNLLVVRWQKDGSAGPVADELASRLGALGARQIRDSQVPPPDREFNEQEIEQNALSCAWSEFVLSHQMPDPTSRSRVRTSEFQDRQTNYDHGRRIWGGYSKHSAEKVVERAKKVTFDEVLRYQFANATWHDRDQALCYYTLSIVKGRYVTRARIDLSQSVCDVAVFRPWWDPIVRPVRRLLGIAAMRYHSRLAWRLTNWFFLVQYRIGFLSYISHRICGWTRNRTTPEK